MYTDRSPTKERLLSEFRESDRLVMLDLPQDNRLSTLAASLEIAMESAEQKAVRCACIDFLAAAADFYHVSQPGVRVLAARPLRVHEGGSATELFGDYHPKTKVIRVWMRTAVLKQVTTFGTFLSTLCHELCHHLDYERLRFQDSWHTRGFYERTAALYHHARGTPRKRLFWAPMGRDRWRIDWPRTNRGG